MGYMKKTVERTRWVTVPVLEDLHAEVRAEAIRQRKSWPAVMAEAMRLWLQAKAIRAA